MLLNRIVFYLKLVLDIFYLIIDVNLITFLFCILISYSCAQEFLHTKIKMFVVFDKNGKHSFIVCVCVCSHMHMCMYVFVCAYIDIYIDI